MRTHANAVLLAVIASICLGLGSGQCASRHAKSQTEPFLASKPVKDVRIPLDRVGEHFAKMSARYPKLQVLKQIIALDKPVAESLGCKSVMAPDSMDGRTSQLLCTMELKVNGRNIKYPLIQLLYRCQDGSFVLLAEFAGVPKGANALEQAEAKMTAGLSDVQTKSVTLGDGRSIRCLSRREPSCDGNVYSTIAAVEVGSTVTMVAVGATSGDLSRERAEEIICKVIPALKPATRHARATVK